MYRQTNTEQLANQYEKLTEIHVFEGRFHHILGKGETNFIHYLSMFFLFGKQNRDEKPRYREEREEKEIVFSKVVKAGKRVYYLDVKKDRRDDLFLSITESKRKNMDDGQFIYEKHKIFLYKEDFDKFEEALSESLEYMRKNGQPVLPSEDSVEE